MGRRTKRRTHGTAPDASPSSARTKTSPEWPPPTTPTPPPPTACRCSRKRPVCSASSSGITRTAGAPAASRACAQWRGRSALGAATVTQPVLITTLATRSSSTCPVSVSYLTSQPPSASATTLSTLPTILVTSGKEVCDMALSTSPTASKPHQPRGSGSEARLSGWALCLSATSASRAGPSLGIPCGTRASKCGTRSETFVLAGTSR
mmetsp:Transcript_82984/g.201285  ORF Transcript_82984/g.201285 Transcript_82984/m.201285 type:complete len:207 (-) Transcript_82984:149-769(-)